MKKIPTTQGTILSLSDDNEVWVRENHEQLWQEILAVEQKKQDRINIDVQNEGGKTALHQATEDNNVGVVEQLLEAEADPSLPDSDENTPLHTAVMHDNESIVELLLEHGGVDVDCNNNEEKTLLHFAAEHGSQEIVRLLLDHGAEAKKEDLQKRNALHYAVEHPDLAVEIIKLLIENGASVNDADFQGRTPLHHAILANGPDKVVIVPVKVLLDAGADFRLGDFEGSTPLHHAANRGRKEIAALLLDMDADINARDHKDRTPLHCTVDCEMDEFKSEEIARLFLERGANVNDTYKKCATPLHYASYYGNERMIKLLIENGASVEGVDNSDEHIGEENERPLDIFMGNWLRQYDDLKDDSMPSRAELESIADMLSVSMILDHFESEKPLSAIERINPHPSVAPDWTKVTWAQLRWEAICDMIMHLREQKIDPAFLHHKVNASISGMESYLKGLGNNIDEFWNRLNQLSSGESILKPEAKEFLKRIIPNIEELIKVQKASERVTLEVEALEACKRIVGASGLRASEIMKDFPDEVLRSIVENCPNLNPNPNLDAAVSAEAALLNSEVLNSAGPSSSKRARLDPSR